jgi:hypothetical protein
MADTPATKCYFCTRTRPAEQVHSRDFPGFEAINQPAVDDDWDCVGWLCDGCANLPGKISDFAHRVRRMYPKAGIFITKALPDGRRSRVSYYVAREARP